MALWGLVNREVARIVAIGLLATLATPASADWEKDVAQLNREATTFFAQFIKDREQPIETCMIEPKWSTYSIPYNVAHAFLGLNVHADLENVDGPEEPAKLLVAAGVAKDAICDGPGRDRYTQNRVEAWQREFKALAPGAKPKSQGFYTYRCAYSFPAFNQTFTRAIAVEVCDSFSNFFDEKGVRKRGSISGGASAETYRRDRKGWHKVETIEMASWD